jgi:hypothetical protein
MLKAIGFRPNPDRTPAAARRQLDFSRLAASARAGRLMTDEMVATPHV